MPKMTIYEILTALDEVRHLTSPPNTGEVKKIGIDEVAAADAKLLTLQERLLDDYGNDPSVSNVAAADEPIMDLMQELHKAEALTVKSGRSNDGINPDLKGIYVTAQKGLAVNTYFLGVKLSTGEQIAEWVN